LAVSEGDPMSKPYGSDSGFAFNVVASMSSFDRAGEDAVSDQGDSLPHVVDPVDDTASATAMGATVVPVATS
jgi:hypothetical protein